MTDREQAASARDEAGGSLPRLLLRYALRIGLVLAVLGGPVAAAFVKARCGKAPEASAGRRP